MASYLTKAKNGDQKALEQLLEETRSYITKFIYRCYPTQRSNIEDLVQETLVSLLKNFEKIEPLKFASYMQTTARNKVKDFKKNTYETFASELLQNSSNLDGLSVFENVQDSNSLEKTVLERLSLQEILEELKKIPLINRVPLTLFGLYGLSYREITGQTSISESTIRTRIYRGRRILEERLHQRYLIEPTT